MIDILPLAKLLVGILIASAAVQAVLACGMYWKLCRFRRRLLPDDLCPSAVVVLCLRGSDPFLSRCIHAILDQDYPRFELRIVVDHATDPALPVAEQVLAQCGEACATIQPLVSPRGTCSLKCSSLVQAAGDCDESVAFLAQLDADVVPHTSWLRELATALAEDRVGAATGNRWYMPDEPTWGALARYAWNAAAVVQMYWFRIAWGGTLAIRTSVLRDMQLLERWRHAFCEDTMLFRLLREGGWKLAFVPSLMMINRETCDVPGFCRWVSRQLLTARLYHPRWPAVILHGLGTTAILASTVGLGAFALASGQGAAALWAVAGLALYQSLMLGLLAPLEWLVRRIAAARGEPVGWLSPATCLRLSLAIPLTQILYPATLLTAMRMRQVAWRGVTYQIDGPWSIRLVEYRPYAPPEVESQASAASL